MKNENTGVNMQPANTSVNVAGKRSLQGTPTECHKPCARKYNIPINSVRLVFTNN